LSESTGPKYKNIVLAGWLFNSKVLGSKKLPRHHAKPPEEEMLEHIALAPGELSSDYN
jgi:hypothetical protein